MILGVVNAHSEATILLPVRDAAGHEHEIEAVLDTGFNGSRHYLPLSLRPWGSLGAPVAW